MKEKLISEESDKSLVLLKRLVKLIWVLSATGGVIAGIKVLVGANDYIPMVAVGLLVMAGSIFVAWLGYKISMISIWVLWDIKVIRTAVTGNQLSEHLINL